MAHALDRELKKLLTGTNDQRRRVGQALWHFYRSLAFWMAKGRGLYRIARDWAAGGELVFRSLAEGLRDLGDAAEDARLRAWLAGVLRQLSDDLERGDHMLVPFLRWLEARFPELTAMIREEGVGSRIYDHVLARELAGLFAYGKAASREGFVEELRRTAGGLADVA